MSEHRTAFVDLVKAQGWTAGAELGVDKGILFGMLLASCPHLSLVGVDLGVKPERRAKVEGIAQRFNGRASLMIMSTDDAAGMVPDHSLDFVFIDADHGERAVSHDIANWQPKVRVGGWLGGHDYHPKKFPGVVKAVNVAFGSKRVQHWPGTIWGLWP